MNPFYESTDDGLILLLHAQPGASSTGFAGLYNGRLKLRVAAKAVEGAANKSACQFIAAFFGVSKSCVTLLQGEKSREKRILIQGDAAVLMSLAQDIVSADQDT